MEKHDIFLDIYYICNRDEEENSFYHESHFGNFEQGRYPETD
jgi:hypothetical protein